MSLESELRRWIREAVHDAVRAELQAAREEMRKGEAPRVGYLRVAEAAALARVHVQTVRRWISKGKLPTYGEGRMVRVKIEDLERLLAAPLLDAIDFAARARELRAGRRA